MDAAAIIAAHLPHAPDLHLYRAPHIPAGMRSRAARSYGFGAKSAEVLALFDHTMLGTAGDGILFTRTFLGYDNGFGRGKGRVPYTDLITVREENAFFSKRLIVVANADRAAVEHTLAVTGESRARPYLIATLTALIDAGISLGTSSPAPALSENEARDEVVQLLTDLGRLRDAGVLTASEFKTKKAELLARL